VVEADFQEHYGLDLADAMYGRGGEGGCLTARRAVVLITNLPAGSRTMRAIGGDAAWWTPDRTLLGLVVERLDALHVSTVRIAGGKSKKPPEVVPRPKPSERRRHLKVVPTADALAALDKSLAAAVGEAG
jgi:hypothetical protein